MAEQYFSVNIRMLLDHNSPSYIGENGVQDILSDFSCPNEDVAHFLHHNAIDFTKKDQSVTYLVFDAKTTALVGYYSIALKPLSIRADRVSKTMAKKISRVSILDEANNTYTTSAYLIAQLGKNYSIPMDQQIAGNDLLDFALKTISNGKYALGGIVEFLECEDNPFLLDFYTANNFQPFDERITQHIGSHDSYKLHQLLKFI